MRGFSHFPDMDPGSNDRRQDAHRPDFSLLGTTKCVILTLENAPENGKQIIGDFPFSRLSFLTSLAWHMFRQYGNGEERPIVRRRAISGCQMNNCLILE